MSMKRSIIHVEWKMIREDILFIVGDAPKHGTLIHSSKYNYVLTHTLTYTSSPYIRVYETVKSVTMADKCVCVCLYVCSCRIESSRPLRHHYSQMMFTIDNDRGFVWPVNGWWRPSCLCIWFQMASPLLYCRCRLTHQTLPRNTIIKWRRCIANFCIQSLSLSLSLSPLEIYHSLL